MIIYELLNHITIDWSSLIVDTMLKAKGYPAYPLPYSLLISRICEYKGVSTTGELVQHTLASNKIGKSALKQISLIPLGNTYIPKGDLPNDESEDDQEMLEY